jgi:aminoglycoside phosphotransferase (APT) family kinase protein
LAAKLANAFEPGPLAGMIWPIFLDRYRSTLTDESIEVGTRMTESKTWLAPDPAIATICHCDYRLDNMLFGDPLGPRSLTVVDWQTAQLGNGVSDVSYFISAAMPPERRRQEERTLVERYYAALSAYDIGDYDFDRCWDDYRRHSFGGFFMAVFASIAVGRTERGDAMFMKMANGAAAQVVDLDALGFLSK